MITLVSFMIPINCKITNFPYTCLLAFLRDHHNYFLARALASTLHIHSFSAQYAVL